MSATAVTVSKLGVGVLSLGATPQDFSWQVTNCRLEPSHEEADQRGTLAKPKRAAEITTSWVLAGTVIQDWEVDGPEGFADYCQDNNGVEVPYVFTPNTDAGKTYTGNVQIRAVIIGGDVDVELTADFSFPCSEDPTRGTTS
jgi:hypothetical protein